MRRLSVARHIVVIAFVGGLASASLGIGAASAQIDATGEFSVATWHGWGLSIRQNGTVLDSCLVIFAGGVDAVPFGTGSIDTATGAFTLSASPELISMLFPFGAGAACSIEITGTFAGDGSSFTAQIVERSTCIPPPFSCSPQCNVTGDFAVTGTREGAPTAACCGNGVLEGSEQCDDGNLSSADCCGACVPEPIGTSCPSDANVCTADQCDPTGTCQHAPLSGTPCSGGVCEDGTCQPEPPDCGPCEQPGPSGCEPAPAQASSCTQPSGPGAARLLVRNLAGTAGDAIRWKVKLPPVPVADLGSPTTSDDYALCVYGDAVPASPTLLLQAHLAAGATCGGQPCWGASATAPTGKVRYRDGAGSAGGTTLLGLKTNASRAKLTLKGKGANLGIADAGWAAPLRVQVRNETGACWESRLDDVVRSTATRLIVENSSP